MKAVFANEVLDSMDKEANFSEIKSKYITTLSDIESIRSQISLIKLEIGKLPEMLKYDEVHGSKLIELNYEKKRFMDCIKMFTCNMESRMCRLLLNHYDARKEINPALGMIVKRGAEG